MTRQSFEILLSEIETQHIRVLLQPQHAFGTNTQPGKNNKDMLDLRELQVTKKTRFPLLQIPG